MIDVIQHSMFKSSFISTNQQKQQWRGIDKAILKMIINKKYPLNINKLGIAKKSKMPSCFLDKHQRRKYAKTSRFYLSTMCEENLQDLKITMGQFFLEKVTSKNTDHKPILQSHEQTRQDIKKYLWKNSKFIKWPQRDEVDIHTKNTIDFRAQNEILKKISSNLMNEIGGIKNKLKKQNQVDFKLRQTVNRNCQIQLQQQSIQYKDIFDEQLPSIQLKQKYPIKRIRTVQDEGRTPKIFQSQILDEVYKSNFTDSFKRFKISMNHKKMLKIR